MWEKVEAANGPSGRFEHSMSGLQERFLVVFGGSSLQVGPTALYNDLYLFDTCLFVPFVI